MLSYQHSYHAGCCADVLKHLTLSLLLQYMKQKPAAFFYLDTHAGRGVYDLNHPQALKTGEADLGIALLWPESARLPDVFHHYLQSIEQINPNNAVSVRHYPGSPAVAINLIRECDRATFCELHPYENTILSHIPRNGRTVFTSHSDGLEQLSAALPPRERRGLIFIDPSYEVKQEYKTIPQKIKQAVQRFSTGTFCLWYPIFNDHQPHTQLLRGLKSIDAAKTLSIQQVSKKPATQGMIGSGLWIINPPFVLKDQLTIAAKTLDQIYGTNSVIE